MIEEQQNNPLHGLKLETLLTELVEHYGWEILETAFRLNCFKINPNIKGSLKFLRNTQWAREKLEDFYLHKFKRMPLPKYEQSILSPRERGFKDGIVPLEPMKLTVESILLSQAKSASSHKERSAQKRENRQTQERRGKPKFSPRVSNKDEVPFDPSNPWNQ